MARTFIPNPLDGYLVIDACSGTVLAASTCYLLRPDALSDAEWLELESLSDSEVCDLARKRGRKLSDVVTTKAKLPGES